MSSEYRHERQFGTVLAVILTFIGLRPLIDGQPPLWIWLGIAAVLLLIAWLASSLLTPVVKVWMKVGHIIGVFNTRLLLAILFFLVVTPLALLFRLVGRDALALRLKKSGSYWRANEKSWKPDSFRNQF
jgi:hypothetical protein